ncbi:uncharacterized protein CC84DRAFT_181681 [Paraphaeosphaeria sporulosa]|uniref:Uncharacterized protein n=1 Tax=Paraphaeosphaeria sporulosa TaxID=1460663 RepID=A0A177D0X6_9PLEO|nr:uncharacterized protein CC84DRAFT_181681 [Paraphaeosphaeria sporulosa]OAG13146.1 hypothetical protein CC84DRAFT_181681 [Paraphaeosphaeria sporulosa]
MSRAPMDWVTAKEKAGKFIHPAQKQAMGWELDEFQHNPGSLMESIKILEEMKVRNAARLSEGVGLLPLEYFRPTRPIVQASPQRPATAVQQSAIPTSSQQIWMPEPLNIPQPSALQSLPHTPSPLLRQLPGQRRTADASEVGLIPSPYAQRYRSQIQCDPRSISQLHQRSILPTNANPPILCEPVFEPAQRPATRTPQSLSPPATAILHRASGSTAGDSRVDPPQCDYAWTSPRPRSGTFPLPITRRDRFRTSSVPPPPPSSRCTCEDGCVCSTRLTEHQVIGLRGGHVNSPWYKSLFKQARRPRAPKIQISPPSRQSAHPRPENANAAPAEQQLELLLPQAARRARLPTGLRVQTDLSEFSNTSDSSTAMWSPP